jgi:Short C-terminal domain
MMFRRRAPLLRGALVAGTGYAVGRNAANRRTAEAQQDAELAQLQQQQDALAAQQAPPPPPPAAPAAPAGGSVVDELAKLGSLKTQGLISDEEFAAAKAKLLGI